jgi:hypothetical protein
MLVPDARQRYCDDACRQAAHRDRQRRPNDWESPMLMARRRRNRDLREWARDQRDDLSAWVRDALACLDRDGVTDELLEDERIRKVLLLALVTDSDDEADTALQLARKLHREGRQP